MVDTVDATFFAQVDPDWYQHNSWSDPHLRGAKVVTTTQKKPARPKGGTVLVKLTIRLPVAAFLPLRPEVVVVIPGNMTEVSPIEVIAEDPA